MTPHPPGSPLVRAYSPALSETADDEKNDLDDVYVLLPPVTSVSSKQLLGYALLMLISTHIFQFLET